MALLHRLLAAREGSIAIMGALSLTGVIGMSGMAVEVGNGYATKVRNQRVADMAALAAGVSYVATSSMAAAQQTARDVVAASGLPASTATVTPTADSTALQVTVQTQVPIQLMKVLSSAASYNVTNTAVAALPSAATPGCLVVLGSGADAIRETGQTAISSTGCAVRTNGGVSLQSSSTTISGSEVAMGKTLTGQQNWITTSPKTGNIKQNQTTPAVDYAKGNAALKAALCQVNKLKGTSDSDYPDGNTVCTSARVVPTAVAKSNAANWSLGYNPVGTSAPDKYQTSAYSCRYAVPAGTYTIGTLNVPGGCSISFANGSTLKIDAVTLGGGALLTIGDGTVTIVGDLNPGSSTVTIGNGAHSFGSITVAGGGKVVVGTGNLTVVGKVNGDGGGSGIGFNIAAGETVAIGNDGAGTAINVSGGAAVCFTAITFPNNQPTCGAPTAVTGAFSANGSVKTAGGSNVVFPTVLGPAGSTHIINGDLTMAGSATFGAGLYVIAGVFTNATGGTVTGTDVTFALGGTFTLGGGTSLTLIAPGASSSYGVPELLIATKSTSATAITAGSVGRYAGLIYTPKSALSLTGGASMGSGGGCMMMIADTVTLSGGTTVTSACPTYQGTTGSGSVALLQ